MKPNKFFSAIFIVFGVLLLNPLSAQRATLPYSNDFTQIDECVNNTDTEWETNCRREDYTIYCVGQLVYSDMLSFLVEVSTSSLLKETSAIYEDDLYGDLKLDLSSVAGNINVNFDWAIISGNDSYTLDGVYVSDDNGSTFTKVLSFEFQDNNWHQASLTVGNQSYDFNDQFIVRFQFHATIDVSNPSRTLLIDNLEISASDCSSQIDITQDITGGTHEYLASSSITATNEISDGATVHYGANSSVKLQTGFKVNSGVSFVADLDGCGATATLKSTNLGGSNEDEQEVVNYSENIVNIYPNPSQGQFNISVKNESKVTILNSFGTLVYKGNLQVGENKVDLSQNSKGLFVIVVDDGNQAITEKVLIE